MPTTETQVRERPILFSDAMIRAVLDGTKTQTRRVVTRRGKDEDGWHTARPDRGYTAEAVAERFACPYEVGMRLWVREAWAPMCRQADPYCWCETEEERKRNHYVEYRADTGNPRPGDWPADTPAGDDVPRWRPSIRMPRWASRITLEVTDVRVERLDAITEADAQAEGVSRAGVFWAIGTRHHRYFAHDPRSAFAYAWDRLNADRGYSFDASPWVWCITFRRLEATHGDD